MTPPIYKLDMKIVGVLLAREAATACQFGHTQVRSTSRSYGGTPTAESQFVRDILTRPTDEVALRWWGSELEACAYICGVVAGDPDPLLDQSVTDGNGTAWDAGGLDAATPAG
jgi:hypothetical protein